MDDVNERPQNCYSKRIVSLKALRGTVSCLGEDGFVQRREELDN